MASGWAHRRTWAFLVLALAACCWNCGSVQAAASPEWRSLLCGAFVAQSKQESYSQASKILSNYFSIDSATNMELLWLEWVALQGKTFESRQEKEIRNAVWQSSVYRVLTINSNPETTYWACLNKFAAETWARFQGRLSNLPFEEPAKQVARPRSPSPTPAAPTRAFGSQRRPARVRRPSPKRQRLKRQPGVGSSYGRGLLGADADARLAEMLEQLLRPAQAAGVAMDPANAATLTQRRPVLDELLEQGPLAARLGQPVTPLQPQMQPLAAQAAAVTVTVAALPSAVDWRALGVVPPVRDQGDCAYSWAYAAAGAIEARVLIAEGKTYAEQHVDVSTQQLVDCAFNYFCGSGGSAFDAFAHAAEAYLVPGSAYRMREAQVALPACPASLGARGGLRLAPPGYIVVQPSMGALMEAVAEQPVVVEIEVDATVASVHWQHYANGLLSLPQPTSNATLRYHSLLLVGYDARGPGPSFWIAQNSYGPSWGDGGYLKIPMLDDGRGVGGMYLRAYRPTAAEGLAAFLEQVVADPPPSPPPAPPRPMPSYCEAHPSTFYIGGDLGGGLGGPTTGPAECCELCYSLPNCYAWSFIGGFCQPKGDVDWQHLPNVTSATAGLVLRPPPPSPPPYPPDPPGSGPTPGIVTAFLGGGGVGWGPGDGVPATQAWLTFPFDITLDNGGNLLVVDRGSARVRKVSRATGIVSTVAGRGILAFCGDNAPARSACLYDPIAATVDPQGNMYIAELTNGRIRMVNATTQLITTIAGTSVPGYAGDGGPAVAARLQGPTALALDPRDGRTLYVCDIQLHCVRRISPDGIITLVIGTPGRAGYSGDGGPAVQAQLNTPWGIAVDSQGNLFVADSRNNRVRVVNASTGIVTSWLGNGSTVNTGDGGPVELATVRAPVALAIRGHALFVSMLGMVRRVDLQTGVIRRVAGVEGALADSADGGPALTSTFNGITSLAVEEDGSLLVLDYSRRVRRVQAPLPTDPPTPPG